MRADYEPQDQERCIRCRENDTIFVQKPFVFHFMVSDYKYKLSVHFNDSWI